MAETKPTPRELAAQYQTGPATTAPPETPSGSPGEAIPTLEGIAAASRAREPVLSRGLESRGLSQEDLDGTHTPSAQDAPAGETTVDPVRITPQFLKAAHHLALMGMHTAEQIGQMETSEVFRLGAIAGERVRESSVQRQQAVESARAGEGASTQEGGDAVPDPELEAKLRKTLEPVFESLGEAEGEKVLQAALSDAARAIRTPQTERPATVAPDPTAAVEVERLAGLRAQIQAARVELVGTYPQLANDATLESVTRTADALSNTHRFADVKSAIEAGAMALFGKAVVAQAQGDAARVQEEAARRLSTPEDPSGSRRAPARRTEDTRTPQQKRWDYFNAVADNPGDPDAAMRKAGLMS